MPARQEWIHSNGSAAVEEPQPLLSETLSVDRLVAIGGALFPDFPYDSGNFESRRGHIAFAAGKQGCIMTVRTLHGEQYSDFAAVLRETFAAGLPVTVGPFMRTREAAGFAYSLDAEAVL